MDFNTDFANPGAGTTLTRRRKAALIVQLLISDGGKLSLSSLPEHIQEALALEVGNIRLVDRDTVNAVAEEFTQILSAIGLSGSGDPNAALDALADLISPDLVNRLRARLGGPLVGDQWPKIVAMEVEELTEIMRGESIEIGAVLLSKLPVTKAAGVLAALPGDHARKITFAVSQTADIAAEAVARIGIALVQEYGGTHASAFEKPPVDRVGAILNSSSAATREDVLAGLEDDDAQFAKGVRKAIFTFADIPLRITPSDVPNVIRAVDADVLNVALAAALSSDGPMNDAAEFLLANISQRMATSMREEAADKGKIKASVAEEAMNTVTSAIREQVDNGLLRLVDPDEAEEEEAA